MRIPLWSRVHLDEMTAVYRLYDAADRLLYVGVTRDLDIRFKQHAREKPWWPEVARKDVTWFANRLDAFAEESQAIATENPVHNDSRGLGRIGMAIIERRSWRYGFDRCPVRPELVVSKTGMQRILIEVEENQAVAAVAVDQVATAVYMPIAHYRKLCAAMGEPINL